MLLEDAISKSKQWIDLLIGKELQYITGRNIAVINRVDWEDEGKIFVARGEGHVTIRFERIVAVVSKLLKGYPTHVDTVLRSGSNDRSVIETIIANFPPVGFMKPSQGRNQSKNKVIQWLNKEIHPVGMIQDISETSFTEFVLNNINIDKMQNLPKPFMLLAGISGTGKTRFVREQAQTHLNETYCLTSVRPDWHEPSDLLGYVSRLTQSGQAEYVSTDVLTFIVKAWRAIADATLNGNGLSISEQQTQDNNKRMVVTGDSAALKEVLPYWLCLDEMNLAPVEQYFADYLSVIETRNWQWDGDAFCYSCDALLKSHTINEVADKNKLRQDLGLQSSDYDQLWQLICKYGLAIPFNLIVAGTVNMDETTHGFSRKVIDRALSIDFGEFYPNDIDEYFDRKTEAKKLTYPVFSQVSLEQFSSIAADKNAEKTKQFFNAINTVLKGTPFELAFRAFNELCLTVISFKPETDLQLAAVFDDFLMCKVLPRIEGDEDKLLTRTNNNLLRSLEQVVSIQLNAIWPTESSSTLRPDLLRQSINEPEKLVLVPCRTKQKLEAMQRQLDSGFCSFWP